MDRPLEQSTWASSSDKDLALFENNSLQANCKSEALTLSMAKEVGEVAKRLGATFVDLHTALMCPDVNRRAALRLEASNAVLAKKSLIKDLVLLRTKLLKWSFFGPFFTQKSFFLKILKKVLKSSITGPFFGPFLHKSPFYGNND